MPSRQRRRLVVDANILIRAVLTKFNRTAEIEAARAFLDQLRSIVAAVPRTPTSTSRTRPLPASSATPTTGPSWRS